MQSSIERSQTNRKKKNSSNSPDSNNSHSRSRERMKLKKKVKKQNLGPEIGLSPSAGLLSLKHFCCLTHQRSDISEPYAIWNLCRKFSPYPKKMLIVCPNSDSISCIQKAKHFTDSLYIITDNRDKNLDQLLRDPKISNFLATKKKTSIICALQCQEQYFHVIVNASFCFEPHFYRSLCSLLFEQGKVITLYDRSKQIDGLRALGIEIKQTHASLSEEDKNRQAISHIVSNRIPIAPEIYSLIDALPLTPREIAARLMQLYQRSFQLPSSVHLGMTGYVTYQLQSEVEFASVKYVWNFIKQEFHQEITQKIQGMSKFKNQKGVVFNIPLEQKPILDSLISHMNKNRKKYKGYMIYETRQVPQLEDPDSPEHKELQHKMEYALRHKNDLQIFFSGLPWNVSDTDVKKFFKEHQVSVYMVRVLKDSHDDKKNIGFGLCENQQALEKAVGLSGQLLEGHTITIKLANRK